MSKQFLLIVSLFITFSLTGQSNFWKALPQMPASRGIEQIPTQGSQYFSLETAHFKKALQSAPNEYLRSENFSLMLPTPEGFKTFTIQQTKTLAPELQSKYPEINNYLFYELENPANHGRLDVSYNGFHAIMRYNGKTFFIDPTFKNEVDIYQLYTKENLSYTKELKCLTELLDSEHEEIPDLTTRNSDTNKRSYRIVVSCDSKYSGFHGNTLETVLSAVNTTINRINFVYEQDFAIRFNIIADQDKLIFLDAATDPFLNLDIGEKINKNRSVANDAVGSANFDIGHVFSTEGAGLASFRAVCGNNKAVAGTGISSPVGDPYDIDYVAHEIGHQVGGGHTQNNDCNRDNSVSYEPGSASTIMGYAGICDPNVQNNSDAYFHGGSIIQIFSYMQSGNGNNCAVREAFENTPPVLDSITPNQFIPKRTPFELAVRGSSDYPLTYCWEQMDREVAEAMPPSGLNTRGPLFRSYTPVDAGHRTFPSLNYIVNNSSNTWEVLPNIGRILNFKVTARENRPGGAMNSEEDVRLTVAPDAGPFEITSPNVQNLVWYKDEIKDITWAVSNTDISPVDCDSVSVSLSVDGGYSYTTIIESTPNNGLEVISVPVIESDKVRIRVQGKDRAFFDISNYDLTIKPYIKPFTFELGEDTVAICRQDTQSVTISGLSQIDTLPYVLLSLSAIPNGVTAWFDNDTLYTGETAQLFIANQSPTGTRSLRIHFNNLLFNESTLLRINSIAAPNRPTQTSPANESENIGLSPILTWNAATGTNQSFSIEISTDKLFQNIIYTQTGITTNLTTLPTVLSPDTDYYWRIRSGNSCGNSEYTVGWFFRTGKCESWMTSSSSDIPPMTQVELPALIPITQINHISDVNVINLEATSDNINTLKFSIRHDENNTTRTLFSGQCAENKSIKINFDDQAETAEIPCGGDPLGNGLSYKPEESLDALNAGPLSDEISYTLLVENTSDSPANLSQWGLSLCGDGLRCRPTHIPSLKGTYKADLACTDSEGWTHYSISAANNPLGDYDFLLVSLQNVDVFDPALVYLNLTGSNLLTRIPNAQYIQRAENWRVLNRFITFENINSDITSNVRFYLTEAEQTALLNAKSGNTLDSLVMFSIRAIDTLNPDPSDLHEGINYPMVTEVMKTHHEYNTKYYLEGEVNTGESLCLGVNGVLGTSLSTGSPAEPVHISIYPNPAGQTLFIVNESGIQIERLIIQNIHGTEVLSSQNIQSKASLDISGLPAGMYFVRIKGLEGKYFKLMKM